MVRRSSSPYVPVGTKIGRTKTAVTFLAERGLKDLTDHDAYFDLFYDEDLRFEYVSLFRKFTEALNVVFPSREAIPFMKEYQRLAEINVLAEKHFRDARLSMKGIPEKLRKITDAYLQSRGVTVKVKPISILDEEFQKEVQGRTRAKTKAAEIEHAIRHHLDIELDDDPDLQASFAESLRKILEDFRDNWNKIYEELEKLRQRIANTEKEPTYGLHKKKQMPFFRVLKRALFGDNAVDDGNIAILVTLTQHIYTEVERELKLAGFWESIPARNKLKADIQRVLLQADFAQLPGLIANRAQIISRVMEIAEKNNDIILYAQ